MRDDGAQAGADDAGGDDDYLTLATIVRDRERRARLQRRQTEQRAALLRRNECFLCHYGATSWSVGEGGIALFHDLERIIAIRIAQIGPERTAYLACRFHEERLKPAWQRMGVALPPMSFAGTLEHLSNTPVMHTLNPRLALINDMRDEWAIRADMKDHYRRTNGEMDANVIRELRLHGEYFWGLYEKNLGKMLFHDGVDGDLQPDMLAHLLPGMRAHEQLERDLTPGSLDWLMQLENEAAAAAANTSATALSSHSDEEEEEDEEDDEVEALFSPRQDTPADRQFRHLLPPLHSAGRR
jgi:hypothetical protein